MFPRRRRTRLLGPVLVASALLLASACTSAGDSSPSPAASSSPATASPTGPVTLRFAVYGGAAELAAYRVMAHAYERREPDVTVRVEGVGGAAAERARLDRQFEAGTAPDVFLTPSTALPRLVEDDRVQPVDGLLETRGVQFGDHYERLGLEAFAADSALQCMPDDVSPQVVFYNKRLLTPAVLATLATPEAPQLIPQVNGWTWEQFGTAARRITRPGVKGVYLAPTLETLTPLLRSAGTDIVDDPKRPTTLQLSDGTARSTLESILRLARNPRITLTGAQIASESVLSRFEHNRLGMITGTRALVPVLRAMPGLQFDVYPLPRFDHFATVADVSGYCISKDSQNIATAADFVTFASSDTGAGLTATSGGIVPANLDVLGSQAFRQLGQFPLNVDVFTRMIRRADTMPNPPAWPQVVRQTQAYLDRLFYAPAPDLDTVLSRVEEISAGLLAEPTPSPSPSDSASASP